MTGELATELGLSPSDPVAGVDEVGRGPLAGPVLAAAVILPEPVDGITDSKLLSPARREALAAALAERAIDRRRRPRRSRRSTGSTSCALPFWRCAAPSPASGPPARAPGRRQPAARLDLPTRCVVGGDALVPAIGAASIVAKVARDRLMCRLATRYPGYGWERNAGYGTAEHRAALGSLGLTPHHRRSFAPCRLTPAGDG